MFWPTRNVPWIFHPLWACLDELSVWNNVHTIHLLFDFLSTMTIYTSMENMFLISYLDRNNLFLCDISPLCDIVIMYIFAPASRCLVIKGTVSWYFFYFFASQTEQKSTLILCNFLLSESFLDSSHLLYIVHLSCIYFMIHSMTLNLHC